MAELHPSLSFSSFFSLSLKVSGYRDPFLPYLKTYLPQIFSFTPSDEGLFEVIKERERTKYANYFLEKPYQLAYSSLLTSIREGAGVCRHKKLAESSEVTL